MNMNEQPATTAMIATIHTLKRHAGLADDDNYRNFLQRHGGVRSAKDLSVRQASRVIERMRELAGGEVAAKGAVPGLDGPVGSKLRALWISGYNLGLVRDNRDTAMLSFLQKVTGVSHVRFLKEPRDGASAIEGLKSWLARDGKVEWPANSEDVIGAKRAVLNAQWARLIELGAVQHIGGANTDIWDSFERYAMSVTRLNRWEAFGEHNYDDVQKALGRKLRGALARRDQAEGAEA